MISTPFITDKLLHQQNKADDSNHIKQFGFNLKDVPDVNIHFVKHKGKKDQKVDLDTNNRKESNCPEENLEIPDRFKEIKKISITKKDLGSLGYHSWVSDEVINSYLAYLHNTHIESKIGYTNTFFYVTLKQEGNEYASKWGGICGYRVDIFSHFLIPITTGAHWFLVDLNFENQAMEIYDSLSHRYTSYTKKIADFLAFQGISPIEIKYPSVPRQTTHYDCGVFLMKFATMIYENKPIQKNSFNQKSISTFRCKVKEILSKYLPSK